MQDPVINSKSREMVFSLKDKDKETQKTWSIRKLEGCAVSWILTPPTTKDMLKFNFASPTNFWVGGLSPTSKEKVENEERLRILDSKIMEL